MTQAMSTTAKDHDRRTDMEVLFFGVKEVGHTLQITQDLDGTTPEYSGDPGKSIVRLDTNEIIGNVSSDYKVIPHKKVIENIEAVFAANKVEAEVHSVHTGGVTGHRMYVNYILPKLDIKVGNDIYHPYVQAFNSYDKSMSFGTITGLFRSKCSNGILLGVRDTLINAKKHYQSVDLDDMILDIDAWFEQIMNYGSKLEKLLTLPIPGTVDDVDWLDSELDKIFERKIHISDFKESGLIEKYKKELGDNQYAIFNALTDFATHSIEDPEKIRSFDMARKVQRKITTRFVDAVSV